MAKLTIELTTKTIKKAALLTADMDLSNEDMQKIEEQEITVSEAKLNELLGSEGVMMSAAILIAQFIKKVGLSKQRKDDIKRFYYYKSTLRGKTIYLNVAETDFIQNDGKLIHKRFLYSVTDKLKQ